MRLVLVAPAVMAPFAVTGSLVAVLLMAGAQAWACRCPEQPLAGYYDAAELVFAGRIEGVDPGPQTRLIRVAPLGEPWKGSLPPGQSYLLGTSATSAGCGLAAQPGEVWILFVNTSAEGALTSACEGSRPLLIPDQAPPGGFADVPVAHVPRQLNALAGLEVLRRLRAATAPRLLGLLDIESLAHGARIVVHAGPSAESAEIGVIASMADVRHREASYEFAAAQVYEASDFGYRIRLQDGRLGWIAAEHGGTWFPYEELIVRRLNYLKADWHRFLWPDPGAGLPLRVAPSPTPDRPRAAEVVDVARIADSLWLRVNVLASDGCDGGERRILASGWTPSWDTAGEPVAWYHSRGC